MTLPVAEEALQGFLGDKFSKTSIWRKTLGQLIGYEDGDEALKVLAQARSEFEPISSFPAPHCPADQLTSSENKLMEVIADLHQRKHILTSGMPTINDLVDPADEHDIRQSQFDFQTDVEIVAAI
ncbi:hypothetical protein B0H10DRAFT_2216069 [Mycena sp. CBHHK59/15]|nr:hypothetical protein B0H10DRAFT_2216069 [Mycena sp. CBHHK59/15]